MKDQERLRNYYRLEDTKETDQQNTVRVLDWILGQKSLGKGEGAL